MGRKREREIGGGKEIKRRTRGKGQIKENGK